ncbi:MAG: RNA polymerase sporulation sigma factor SigK [Clostridia bacterium]|nr:RNA polymerase sporulation sigma factor SigK [Clostridia bacterium]
MILSFLSNIFSYIFFLFGYISSSNLFPEPLSKSEEDYLLKKFFNGDKEAKNKLINHNLRLVAHIAKKYSTTILDNEEFISIGTIGLIKGINSFSENKGVKLSTYCSRCIENEILMHLRGNKKSTSDISINNIIGTDKDGNDMELIDILESDDTDPIDSIYNKTVTKQMLEYIENKLSEREKQIIYMRYGLHGNTEKTQQQVADMLGISRSYVSRIETKIINKLVQIVK